MSDCNVASGKRKRKHFDNCDEENDVSAAKVLIEELSYSLSSFCDEILLEIFKHVDSNSLLSLGRTCRRFHNLISDHHLWRRIDLTSEGLPQKLVKKRLSYMHPHTESIAIKGLTGSFPNNCWNNITLGLSLLNNIVETCENLQIIELHQCFLNFEIMSITDFPKTVRKLIFKSCYVFYPKTPHTFFSRIDVHLQKLEELYVEYCNWFETHDIVVFSKIPLLKKLSLQGCMDFDEFVPYASLAARFGFKKLEYLDVRNTLISDSDIQCFNAVHTLKELLLECPEDIRKGNNGTSTNQGPPQPRPPNVYTYNSSTNNSEDNNENSNSVEIVMNDRSVINIRTPRHVNRPAVQVLIVNPAAEALSDESQEGDQQQEPNINRVITRSLWFERRYPPPFSPPSFDAISDRGILSFGAPGNVAHGRMVWICAQPRPVNNSFEKLIIRHYKLVTDVSLLHLAECSPKLIYLDLTGTGVTKSGVEDFKLKKPDCVVISEHISN